MKSALILIFVFALCKSDFTPEQIQFFGSTIEREFMGPNNIPGVGFAIFRNSSTFAEGYGVKNLENSIRADNRTNFAVASVTKSFTATIVVKTLREKFPELGTGVLNEPITKLLPAGYNFTMIDRYRSETVSFRDLLSHRTCLSTSIIGRTFGAIKSAQEFAYRTRYVKEICQFRTGYNYNNVMYGLIAELIGAIAGSTFSQLGRELLDELEMRDTLLIHEDLDFEEMDDMSRGYYRQDGTTRRFNSQLLKRMSLALPSGGLLPTPSDMLKYINFHLNLGKVGDKQIVPVNMMRLLHRGSFALDFGIEDTSDPNHTINDDYAYGLGLRLGIYDKWAISSHEGTWPPFRSRLSLYPALKLGIFTVTNGPGTLYGLSHQELHEKIFNMLIGNPSSSLRPAQLGSSEKECTKIESASNPKQLLTKIRPLRENKSFGIQIHPADWAGLYGNPVQGDLIIRYNLVQQQLYLEYGTWGTGFLTNITADGDEYNVEFDSDIIGDFLSSSLELPVMRLSFQNLTMTQVVMNFQGDDTVFAKDATLETYPPQPWSPESCGPEWRF